MSGRRAPSAQELLDLDVRLDDLAAGKPLEDDGLMVVAARLASLPESVWDEVAPPALVPGRDRRPARWPGRRSAVVGIAAALVAAAVVSGLVATGGGTPTERSPTAWALAGFVDQPAWGVGAGPGRTDQSVQLTCPSPSTCYADQPARPPAAAVVEVTRDRGTSWSSRRLPAGTVTSTALSCTSSTDCSVGVRGPAGGEVLSTTDGGAHWAASALPDPSVRLAGLACTRSGTCVALGYEPGTTPATTTVAFRTADGGARWTAAGVPGPFVPRVADGLACDGHDCVAVGTVLTGTTASGAVRFSTDGGATWSVSSLPTGLGPVGAVSCSGAGHCLSVATARTTRPGSPAGPLEAMATVDGGRSWRVAAPLVDVDGIRSVSCPTAASCWVAGSTKGSGGLVAVTRDGGASWAPVGLPSGPVTGSGLTTLDLVAVVSVSCPTVTSCLAIGLRGTLGSAAPPLVALRSSG